MPRLRRTNPAQPGLSRERRGRGWSYVGVDGQRIADPDIRARIEELAIPPAWRDVWITPYPNGHLQAVGTDDRGRRQYLYHEAWERDRARLKHRRVLRLGAALPGARSIALEHLGGSRWTQERALAVAFRLLDRGHFRIGGAAYVQANGSYGLSTLLRRHVHRRNGVLIFEYVAKSGLTRVERIDDPLLVDLVGKLAGRRGGTLEELLAYHTSSGWHGLNGEEINDYVRTVTGLDVTAKDFRTWHGTVLGSVALADQHLIHGGDEWTERSRKRAIGQAIAAVAENLGNTPAVCRRSYVNPRAIELFRSGVTIGRTLRRLSDGAVDATGADCDDAERIAALGAEPSVERAVLRMLGD